MRFTNVAHVVLLSLSTALVTAAPAAAQALALPACLKQAASVAGEFDPPGYVRKANLDGVLIFLHGAKQDGHTGWSHPSGGYWPTLLKCDEAFWNFDIFVAEYNGNEERGLDVGDLVDELIQDLQKARVFADHRQAVIVARDFGGFLAREMLTRQPSLAALVPVVAWIDPSGQISTKETASVAVREKQALRSYGEYLTHVTTSSPQPLDPRITVQCVVVGRARDIRLQSREGGWLSLCSTDPVEIPGSSDAGWLPATTTAPPALWLRRVVPASKSPMMTIQEKVTRPPAPLPRTIQVTGPSMNVGCNQAAAGVMPIPLKKGAGDTVILSHAVIGDQRNLKSATARVLKTLENEVLVEYQLLGLDKEWTGNCPGGGQGQIVVTVVVRSPDFP